MHKVIHRLGTTSLRNPWSTALTRSYGKHNKKFLYKKEEGVKYEGIIYYPKDPANHQDPSIEPAKLFVVERIKPFKGNPYWEQKILKDLGLGEECKPKRDIAIVKNISENNARLWKIKHLIKVTPIVFPYGEPTKKDVNYTFLKSDGTCLVAKEIQVDEKRIEATDEFQSKSTRLDSETLVRDTRMRWLNAW